MLVYGRNVAETILQRKELLKKVRKIYIQKECKFKIAKYLIEKTKINTIEKEKKEMDHLVEGIHQGIIIDMEDYQYISLEMVIKKEPNFLIILDHLEDPHNVGAIIRTCSAAGVDAVILPHDRQASINATVMKTSAGTIYNLDIVEVTNLKNTIERLKQEGFWFIGTAMDGEDYRKIDYSGKIALIIGNEGKGISKLIKESCDFIATIPIQKQIDSLNASVASGIMIYEVVRNRK